MKNLIKHLSKKALAGLIFGLALAIGITIAVAFTEPTGGGPAGGFDEPTGSSSTGSILTKLGTPAGVTTSRGTDDLQGGIDSIFNYLLKLRDIGSTEALTAGSNPSSTTAGAIDAYIGTASPTGAGDKNTVFGYFRKLQYEGLLRNLFHSKLTDDTTTYPGGTWTNHGVDDYDNNKSSGVDNRFSTDWVTCDIDNHHCGLGDSETYVNGFKMDPVTRLIWSDPCTGAGCDSFQSGLAYNVAPSTDYEWGGDTSDPGCSALSFDDNDNLNDSSVRLSALELCESGDHGKSGWYLPHQKMLMQASIDGSWGNLSAGHARYWSATTCSSYTSSAWYVYLFDGYTNLYNKSGSIYVRCVRPAGDF